MKKLFIALMLLASAICIAISASDGSTASNYSSASTLGDLAAPPAVSVIAQSGEATDLVSKLRELARPAITKAQSCWRFDDCARRCRLEWQNYRWKSAQDCIDRFPCSQYPKRC